MLKLFLTATITLLVTLATLTACSATTPAPEEVPTPIQVSAKVPAPAPTDAPVSTLAPTERPTAAPRATPANSPTPEATNITAPPRVLAPLQPLDSGAMFSELTDAEKGCIGENPERQTRYVGCLEDETIDRIFLAGFVSGPAPLSQESSDCVRAAFEVIDPKAVMTAGIEGDPGRAMAGSMAALSVTVACLTDQEWEATAPMLGMSPDERAGMQCLMEALGGPGQMATAMRAAQEGEFAELASAGTECELDMGPASQAPVTPPPAPTATTEAATPAPITTTPGPTPTRMPTKAPSTSTPTPTTTLVITVAPIPTDIPLYSRSQWKHWEDHDGDCQDARQEVLIGESLLPVTYKTDRECRVEAGRWYGAFTGTYFEDPGDVDVDHMVPLKTPTTPAGGTGARP